MQKNITILLVYGILVLLDALGTKVDKPNMQEKVKNFDSVDNKLKKNIAILRKGLANHHYNNLISCGTIYDNIQIFLVIDRNIPLYKDDSGKTVWYWSLRSIGELLIDIFRYSLFHEIPLRGCITSGYGEISKAKRILGPVANEASSFYEITDWIGIVAAGHAAIVLNNRAYLNPNTESSESYVEYHVPTKECILDRRINAYRLHYGRKKLWALRWPIHKGSQMAKVTDSLVYFVPSSDKTEYGKVIPNDHIIEIIKRGINNKEENISRKWKHTSDFFYSVCNN